MRIKSKLTYLFVAIAAFIILASSLATYYSSAKYRKSEFRDRLYSKASTTARLLVDVEEVDAALLKIIDESNMGTLPGERVVIYNYLNQRIYTTDKDEVLQIDTALINRVRLEETIYFKQGEYEVLGTLFKGRFDRFVVIAGAIDKFGLSKLRNLRTILMIVFGSSIILVFVSGRLYAGRALSPISKVIRQVENISINTFSSRVDEGNQKDEIAQLASTFNKMLDRLEEAFKVQKNFVANASHELRTPLTSITGQIEVLMMQDRSTQEYKNALNSVLEDMHHMNKLANRLLLLAQASSDAYESSFVSLRVDDLVWQARAELLKRNEPYKVNVAFDSTLSEEQNLIISGNEQLIKSVITNLIENGCKFSAPPECNVLLREENGQLIIEVADKGMGISEEDMVHIFDPFFRSKNTAGIRGHGIGLSLAEKIIKLHKGSIRVDSSPGNGATFTVSFPIA